MTKKETKKLDTLWSEKVKDNAGNKCEYCGKEEYLNSHHFYSRSNKVLRWLLSNGFCLCSGHHMLCNDSAHKAPADFVEWAIKKRGEKWLKSLQEKRNKPFDKTFEEVYNTLK